MDSNLSILANFYFEISPLAVGIGVLAGLGLVIALGFTRRLFVSGLCGAFGCGLIAFCVVCSGRGDMGFLYLVISVPLATLAGGGGGLISASVMRGRKKPDENKPNGPK
jgi:hypothetical protein